MDNGPEVVSQALQRFCADRVGFAPIPHGTPLNNGYIESFNNRVHVDNHRAYNVWQVDPAKVGEKLQPIAITSSTSHRPHRTQGAF